MLRRAPCVRMHGACSVYGVCGGRSAPAHGGAGGRCALCAGAGVGKGCLSHLRRPKRLQSADRIFARRPDVTERRADALNRSIAWRRGTANGWPARKHAVPLSAALQAALALSGCCCYVNKEHASAGCVVVSALVRTKMAMPVCAIAAFSWRGSGSPPDRRRHVIARPAGAPVLHPVRGIADPATDAPQPVCPDCRCQRCA